MDDVDKISGGHKRTCPVCGVGFEDMQVEVVVALVNGHMARKHKES